MSTETSARYYKKAKKKFRKSPLKGISIYLM